MMFILEMIAAITGILGVSLVIRQTIWAWPIGIISVVLYAYILFHAKLYSDVLLHIGYIILNAYCWYTWLSQDKSDQKEAAFVKKISRTGMLVLFFILMSVSAVLGHIMATQTDADLPYWDAFVVIMSFISQILLANKYILAWYGWVMVNILSIGIYWVKALYPTTILYAVYLGLAIIGVIKWQKVYRTQQALASPG
jgi:nicotinamide mononucleotide transporter